MEGHGGVAPAVSTATASSAGISSCCAADPDRAPASTMARVLSSAESNGPAEIAAVASRSNNLAAGAEIPSPPAANSAAAPPNQSSAQPPAPISMTGTMTGSLPSMMPPPGAQSQQRQPHILPSPQHQQHQQQHQQHQQQHQQQQQQRIVCVPNQQAPYPHAQAPQGRVSKGTAVVIRHMTTAPPVTSQAPAAAQQQFVHKYQPPQRPPYMNMYQQPPHMVGQVRHPHPILPMPSFQSAAAASAAAATSAPRACAPMAGSAATSQGQQRIPHPVASPRYVNSGQAAGGVMTASASPQPLKPPPGIHHYRFGQGQTSNGSVPGKSIPSWLPPVAQSGGSTSTMAPPSEANGRDRPGDVLSVIINDRKVRLVSEADTSSLYSLCRRWIRNDIPRKDQSWAYDCTVPLPRPLSAAEVETMNLPELNEDTVAPEVKLDTPIDKLSRADLLKHHTARFKNVRARATIGYKRRIARYRARLEQCFPQD